MIQVTIIADSLNVASPNRERITTMKVTFPRFILAELNTHRMFSRNSASSRAIPFRKMMKSVLTNPCVPLAWQKDHSGMQGTEYFRNNDHFHFEEIQEYLFNRFKFKDTSDEGFVMVREVLERIARRSEFTGRKTLSEWWLVLRDMVVECATLMFCFGVTKQLCNRLLEPFMWHTALITATEWENFFALRCPQYEINHTLKYSKEHLDKLFRSKKDYKAYCKNEWDVDVQFPDLEWFKINKSGAEIHISLLAEAMWDALNESTPKELQAGEWHLPYGDQLEDSKLYQALMQLHSVYTSGTVAIPEQVLQDAIQEQQLRLKIATARCAQTSYTLMDDQDKPLDYAKLIALHDRLLQSMHMSPFEHCSRAMTKEEWDWFHVCYGGINNPDGSGQAFRTEHGWCKNFRGWIQYRALIPNENQTVK